MILSDWIIIAIFVLAFIYGWRRGTVRVLGQIGAVILGYMAARQFSIVVTAYIVDVFNINLTLGNEAGESFMAFLSLFFNTDQIISLVLQIIVSIVIFVVVCWVVKWVANAITSMFGRGLLGNINRALGAFLAFCIAIILLLIFDDIVFPALREMNVLRGSTFLDKSAVIMPLLRRF